VAKKLFSSAYFLKHLLLPNTKVLQLKRNKLSGQPVIYKVDFFVNPIPKNKDVSHARLELNQTHNLLTWPKMYLNPK
jgi:hypothetical protein